MIVRAGNLRICSAFLLMYADLVIQELRTRLEDATFQKAL